MNKNSALIVDDEPDILELLNITLTRMNFNCVLAASLREAEQALAAHQFDICLTDMRMPDGSGIDLVKLIQSNHPDLPVAVITAHGNVDIAIESMKAGAFDFLSKPIDIERLRALVKTATKSGAPEAALDNELLVGTTDVMRKLKQQIHKLARSQAPILITGESGCGKELIARSIHAQGPRCDGPFIAINCGAIPRELMESEFFGHKKGSFTGANADKIGLFQAAEGGTLFLDEVADLPLDMQVKLLRAIQEKAIRPVGTQAEQKTNIRILSATHKNLQNEIVAGNFRQDLYYRINVIHLHAPALRERMDDLEALTSAILNKLAATYDSEKITLTPDAIKHLKRYPFPGNVRELENTLERAFTLCEGNTIRGDDLQLAPMQVETSATQSEELNGQALDKKLEEIEMSYITKALEETRWNRTEAAKKLGISFRSLRYRLKKLGLDTD
ncbi:sigma-54 dependent transcriptional regulator [Simiduia curdlanivorans]|uniref:Sigma-54-dependent transcriptional regulator n=1 Tax=Simiduia curdlanivorans TaxID=1492769 RepID=A0ABV8V8X7_9GAMM|nr:sigma-54 dependent transcriptional regulator [Simiduia curdlanivorans]MDN3638541.1 sigma-54 dependent transcriptional regulator [Simiduia curdlanivorans]